MLPSDLSGKTKVPPMTIPTTAPMPATTGTYPNAFFLVSVVVDSPMTVYIIPGFALTKA